jgi:glutamine amidotransferase-like uncharacterized protein
MESLLDSKVLAPRMEPARTQPPADQLISYDKLVALTEKWSASPGALVSVVGHSKSGRNIFLVALSDPENLRQAADFAKSARESWNSLVRYPSLTNPEQSNPDLSSLVSSAKPALLIHAGGFGFEASHTEAACELVERLLAATDQESKDILRGSVVLVMPMVNPDSRELALDQWKNYQLAPGWQGVGNSYGFIMNRDFYRLSQPENQAVHRVIDEWRPLMALDLHEDMAFLGARLNTTCWVPPFREPRHKNLAPEILEVVAEYSSAIADRWRKEGFSVWHEPKGSFMSYMVLDGRCDMHLDLHGIPCLFTESARTPGSQTWEDRNRQKLTAALAFVHKAAREYAKVLKTEYDYWTEQIRLGIAGPNKAFVIPRSPSQQRDPHAADRLVSILLDHHIQVYSTAEPYPAYVVPLGQPDRNLILAMLHVEPWNMLSLPPALGVDCLKFDALAADQRAALEKANLRRITDVRNFWTKSPRNSAYSKSVIASNTESSVQLVNFALQAGVAVQWLLKPAPASSGVFPAGSFCISDPGGVAQDFARTHSIPLVEREQLPTRDAASIHLPKIAVYVGQGADEKNHTSTGETLWALDFLGFPYAQLNETDIRQGLLSDFDVLILANGAALEMVSGWDVKTQNYLSPWQVPGKVQGLGTEGLSRIARFIERGGRYIGISSGGGALACKEIAGFADVEIADQGVGQARIYLHVEDSTHPVMFSYDGFRDQDGVWHPQEMPAFYFCDQLWPQAENFSGPIFKVGAKARTLASFERVDYEAWTENVQRPPVSLNRQHAAIVVQQLGRGSLVLFGITLGFRAQWISNYRLLSNAIYSWQIR